MFKSKLIILELAISKLNSIWFQLLFSVVCSKLSVNISLDGFKTLFVEIFAKREHCAKYIFILCVCQHLIRIIRTQNLIACKHGSFSLFLFLSSPLLRSWLKFFFTDSHLCTFLSFFSWHSSAIKFNKIRKQFDAILSIERVLTNWVVP